MEDKALLKRKLLQEKAELSRLYDQKKSLLDNEVYRKSCEVDELVVRYMQDRGR